MRVATYDPVRERVYGIIIAMTPEQRRHFSLALNQAIDRHPLGPKIRAHAIAAGTGLGDGPDLTTALTTLAASALKVGGDLYGAKLDAKAASSAAKRDVALQMAQMQALQAQSAAAAAGHQRTFKIIGIAVAAAAVLSVTGVVAYRRLRG